ncbi:MAG: preprotein translocase subunit SecE [Candidatus Nealsonbacteria bacterium RIFCSPLOWO2_12_FULL_39_31]|uniref:Protein translocase subunit SecE n=3 Tax=Candidatus Nealsoniibacteriota TaxID=1817911 RepID=A0A1G2EGJ8_9BACT|nr:MAG: Preprotein translocase, SecE subunit [Parcubacteria group bacterium GW2011_GWA2_38_27]KKQ97659.1 MAG: Preprotein translocase, SecE subunit [Parcubacteria group bacterium GW2011_GWC2_39_11]OGZ20171.1 MAG: preprotein translocase subunit SecE [Candidatus Nealsonbacteria bacterium RIFCSPHIGHO2_01_FULL_38_55]OGZ21453.1 MAG: preprotein translocase subunit SecE [Candidatus Nealsonbacteria bacterium RIFCSPHIGHO2_02_FULL_38_75]OGZ22224.1 MAG: preprotein translocase subunit SecE [Candidatus Neals
MRIGDIPNKIVDFFKEVGLEIKKVNWPSRQETIKYTLIVIGVSLAVALFLGGLDIVFQYLLNSFLLK